MKKIIFLATILMTLISFTSFAQMGGMRGGMGMGGMRGGMGSGMGVAPSAPQGQPQRQNRFENINVIGGTGYFTIDSDEALKKIKIKKDTENKAQAVREIINEFHTSCQEIVATNRTEIDILEFAKEDLELAQDDMMAMKQVATKIRESSKIVRPLMIEKHKTLNKKMNELLNAKELNGWNKYYKSICKHNSFTLETPERSTESDEHGKKQDGIKK